MLKANHTTGLVFFPAYDWAISASHPEREERLLYTQDQILEEGLLDIAGITEFKPDLVTLDDVRRVHFCVPDPWAVMTQSHFISAGGAKTIGWLSLRKRLNAALPSCARRGIMPCASSTVQGAFVISILRPS